MYHYLSRNPKFVMERVNKAPSIYLYLNKHDHNNINRIHVCVFVLHKVLYHENSKMRFLWHRHNGKIDRISQL